MSNKKKESIIRIEKKKTSVLFKNAVYHGMRVKRHTIGRPEKYSQNVLNQVGVKRTSKSIGVEIVTRGNATSYTHELVRQITRRNPIELS